MFPLLRIFFNPSVLRTPPLYFAVQNTEEEVNTFLCIVFVLLPYRVPQHDGEARRNRRETSETAVSEERELKKTGKKEIPSLSGMKPDSSLHQPKRIIQSALRLLKFIVQQSKTCTLF